MLAALGLLALGVAVAGGASTSVKTGLDRNKSKVGNFKIKGQLKTRGGSKSAQKRCLNKREVTVTGPDPTFTPRVAARFDATTKTNAKGRFSILAPPDQFFASGTYAVRVKRRTLGGAKKGSKLVKCERVAKKLRR